MGKVLVTGIDIGHYSIKAVALRESKEQLELVHFHELLMPEGIFADNHTLDHQSIVKKLAELKRALPWRGRKIATAIPDGVVNSKMVQVAQGLEGRELEFAIGQAFGLESPIPIEELSFDFSLFKSPERSVNSTMTYQVHAARKEVIDDRMLAFKKSGLKPISINVHSHALAGLWRMVTERYSDKSQWILVDVGYQHTSLCHVFSGSVFYKDIPYGLKQIQSDISIESKAMEALVDNIKRQINLYNSINGGKAIKGMWLIGGGASDQSLVECFKTHGNVDIALLSPLSLVEHNSQKSSKRLRVSNPNCHYATAFGLALGGFAWLKGVRDDEH